MPSAGRRVPKRKPRTLISMAREDELIARQRTGAADPLSATQAAWVRPIAPVPPPTTGAEVHAAVTASQSIVIGSMDRSASRLRCPRGSPLGSAY